MYSRRRPRDPYRELELYLQQAQDEIGKAFESLVGSKLEVQTSQPLHSKRRSSSPSPTTLGKIPVYRKLSSPSVIATSFDEGSSREEKAWSGKGVPVQASDIFEREDIFENSEDTGNLPRPPSGDIEQLTAWVDTFVEAINTTLHVEDVEDNELFSEERCDETFPSQHSMGTSSLRRPLSIPISERTVNQSSCSANEILAEENGHMNGIITLDRLGRIYTHESEWSEVDDAKPSDVNNDYEALTIREEAIQTESTLQSVNIFSLNPKDFRRLESSIGHDAITQTTPQISRSSSITGVTECSEEAVSISSSEVY